MEHETATLAWLRAEGGQQVILVQRRNGDVLPAKKPDGAALARLIDVRESAVPRHYNVITSAGTIYAVSGGTLFRLATPAQVKIYNEVAKTL